MRIKKFICINCGAPKVNEYKSPYIVCDYCGSFTDIDYTLGLDFWNQSPKTTTAYMFNKIEFAAKIRDALMRGATKEYYTLQRQYWDYYYTTYPAYLPPSVDTPDKYKMYLDVCAESSTNYGFDLVTRQKQTTLNTMQQSLIYYKTPAGETKVRSEDFFRMAEFYINFTKESFKDFYSNPDYAVMLELLPPSVHLKMKISTFVQVWLPYLTEADGDRLLKLAGFSLEYVEIEKPQGSTGKCGHCQADIFIPGGSYKVYCESCRYTTKVQSVFKCMSCGAENTVPDSPYKPVVCQFCGTENRLIKALFG